MSKIGDFSVANKKRGLFLGATALATFLVAVIGWNSLSTNIDASEIIVVQSPVSGELTVHTKPGLTWTGFGTVTAYKRLESFEFTDKTKYGGTDDRLTTRFTDGGTAFLSGSFNWQMPLDPDSVIKLHRDFRSSQAIEQRLMAVAARKTVFVVGSTMSSTASAAEQRPELLRYIDDQLVNGLYATKTQRTEVEDPVTGVKKWSDVVVIDTDHNGVPRRESKSMITEYGIVLQPSQIDVHYDDKVQRQIDNRQESITAVQTSIANAAKAQQDAITAEANGRAEAARAKWEQETKVAPDLVNAERDRVVATTAANRDLEVAKLAAQTAEQRKKAAILEGEGEATKRRLILEADGALQAKLDAYTQVNARYADAIKSAQPGAWTPTVVLGSDGTKGSNIGLTDLLAAKAAKDLGVELKPTK